ncbi:hypothetical protein AVEN_273014-1 [Araneus ventricosus]|uniref:Uncharacterized protein n=1 Tax=Araneus ventricosus TaxID=182803 RepID=A0A4Y2EZ20_ARAVE|nr:hypothetical protein AVEN_273014-1 [Araneus ventricosus]
MNSLVFISVLVTFAGVSSADYDDYVEPTTAATRDWVYRDEGAPALKPDVCVSQPLGGLDWILSVRQPDYGWREETHRAVIVLAVNDWKNLTPQEIRQMELQLEVELTKALLRFSSYADQDGKPVVYSIAGVPNDAEENLYWRLCLQTDVNHDRHDAVLKTIHDSPISFIPKGYDHIIYWYKNKECEET